jgi:2,3-bisphosphoglycerate-independent phosphoglycerate mutase
MKCVVVLACGLADEPREELNGKTPLEAARTPFMDQMAARGILGLTRTTPRGTAPGCQTGGLALLGYDPERHRVGAAALEALGVGVTLAPTDVALRASLVTLDTTEDGTEILRDPLGGRLPVAEAAHVARDLANALESPDLRLVPGVGHRHVVVWRDGDHDVKTTSPYELVDKPVAGREPSGPRSDALVGAMERAREVLLDHPVCNARRARAERVPTALWLWDPAGPSRLPRLRDAFGVEGAIVAASPMGRGLGIAVGLTAASVSGATGDLDTSFAGKVEAALAALETCDLAIVHVGAADTAGHAGDPQRKVSAIERLDELLIGPLLEGLRTRGGDWRVLVAADHVTSSGSRVHGADPVPFCVFTQREEAKTRGQKRGFCEKDAREQGIFIQEAHSLLDRLVRR